MNTQRNIILALIQHNTQPQTHITRYECHLTNSDQLLTSGPHGSNAVRWKAENSR